MSLKSGDLCFVLVGGSDVFPVSFCTCVHTLPGPCFLLSPFSQNKVPVDQHIQHISLRAFRPSWPFLFEYTLVWAINGNEDQYNGTMPMYSDGWREVGLPLICSSKTAPQTELITGRRPIMCFDALNECMKNDILKHERLFAGTPNSKNFLSVRSAVREFAYTFLTSI